MITLEQMRIFVAVAEREHLTRAAEALRLTPSALSSAIRVLEKNSNVALFYRVGRHIRLSEAGRIFLDDAKATLQRASIAERTLEELGNLKRGSLMLFASQTIAAYWLPPLIARYHERYPGIQIELTIANTSRVMEATIEGICDLGFIESTVSASDLEVTRIGGDRLCVVVASNHAILEHISKTTPHFSDQDMPKNKGWDALYDLRWVMREVGSGTRSSFYQAITDRGFAVDKLDVALVLPSNEAVLAAVLSGPYATALSELVVRHQITGGQFTLLPFDLPQRDFSVVTNPARHRSPSAKAFLDHIPKSVKRFSEKMCVKTKD